MSNCLIPDSYAAAYELLEATISATGPSIIEVEGLLNDLIEDTLAEMKVSQGCVDFVQRNWLVKPLPKLIVAEDFFGGFLPAFVELGSFFNPNAQPDFEQEFLKWVLKEHLIDILSHFIEQEDHYSLEEVTQALLEVLAAGEESESIRNALFQVLALCQEKGLFDETGHLYDWLTQFEVPEDLERTARLFRQLSSLAIAS